MCSEVDQASTTSSRKALSAEGILEELNMVSMAKENIPLKLVFWESLDPASQQTNILAYDSSHSRLRIKLVVVSHSCSSSSLKLPTTTQSNWASDLISARWKPEELVEG
jgi:hypothetical protein